MNHVLNRVPPGSTGRGALAITVSTERESIIRELQCAATESRCQNIGIHMYVYIARLRVETVSTKERLVYRHVKMRDIVERSTTYNPRGCRKNGLSR